jgi:hypothetical protein
MPHSFECIFPDSNPLIESEWPRLSVSLRNLFSLAEDLKVPVFLLDPVEKEVRAHFLREYEEALKKSVNCT